MQIEIEKDKNDRETEKINDANGKERVVNYKNEAERKIFCHASVSFLFNLLYIICLPSFF